MRKSLLILIPLMCLVSVSVFVPQGEAATYYFYKTTTVTIVDGSTTIARVVLDIWYYVYTTYWPGTWTIKDEGLIVQKIWVTIDYVNPNDRYGWMTVWGVALRRGIQPLDQSMVQYWSSNGGGMSNTRDEPPETYVATPYVKLAIFPRGEYLKYAIIKIDPILAPTTWLLNADGNYLWTCLDIRRFDGPWAYDVQTSWQFDSASNPSALVLVTPL